MSNKKRSRALFVRADGGPMLFSLVPCSERKEIRELIEYGGGVLVQPEKFPDAIQLVPSSVTVTDSTDDLFSANYIRACSDKDTLFRLVDFKIPIDSNARRLRTVRTRREYTLGEEISIAKYIAKRPGVRVHGNALYKEMASAGVVPGQHSWQSLREHYLKTIFPLKHLYESPNAVDVLSKRQRLEVATEPDSSPVLPAASDVIVQDSDSEQDSRRPRSPPRKGLGVEDTSTDVVPETESSSPSQSSGMSVISKNLRKSKRAKKIVSSASPSPARPENASKKSSVQIALEGSLPRKDRHDHSTSTPGKSSTAVALRKHALPSSLDLHSKKQTEPSTSSASVQAGFRRSSRKGSTGQVDVPENTKEEPILNEQQRLLSSLRNLKEPAARCSMRSGSRIPGIGRPTCAVVSEGQCSSDNIDKPQTPVEQHPRTPVKPDSATLQECSSSHSGQEVLPQSSESSILEDAVKDASASSRTMPLRRSPRKRPNTPPQELTGNHSGSLLCSKPGVRVTPSKGKQNSCSPRQFRATDKGAAEGLLEPTPPLGRRGVTRSSSRKQQSAELQKDSSSQSVILHCSEPSGDTTAVTDLEDPLAPLQTGRRLLPSTSVADRRKKKGISLHSEVASNSVSTEKNKCNTSPRKTQKAKEWRGNASYRSTSPLITPSDETASSGPTSSTGTSAGKRTRSRRSLRQELQAKAGSETSKAKTAREGKKAPKGAESQLSTGVIEVEILDSADEDLLTEALVQEVAFSRSPRSTPDGAEGHPAMATGEVHGDDVSEADSEASTVTIQSAIMISSDSADEDPTPESVEDDISKARQQLVTLLGVLRAGKNMELHRRCPANCDCPRSAQYIQAARAVVSLSAFLAYHGQPLPSESPGIEDPNTALLLEILLRRLEIRNENKQDSSDAT